MTSETSEKAAGTTSTTTEAVASRGTAATATTANTPARGATQFQQVLQPVWDGVGASLPMIITVATHAHTMWTTHVDATLLKALLGGVFCFFGGVFPTLFAVRFDRFFLFFLKPEGGINPSRSCVVVPLFLLSSSNFLFRIYYTASTTPLHQYNSSTHPEQIYYIIIY